MSVPIRGALVGSGNRPPLLRFLGHLATVHAPSSATGGRYALVEMWAPAGSQTPLHVHHHDNEGFFVLEGRLRVHAGPEVVVLRPGGFFLAGSGLPHTLEVEGGGAARWLVTSGLRFDQFVTAVATAGEWPEAELDRIARDFGIEILGPPGALPGYLP